MTLIDGKQTADDIKREIAAEVEEMVAQGKRRPHLAAILVGHDGGSETYVANKVKACEACGFRSTIARMSTDSIRSTWAACRSGCHASFQRLLPASWNS